MDSQFSSKCWLNIEAWHTKNGERLGTYDRHKGAAFDFDSDSDTIGVFRGALTGEWVSGELLGFL